MKNNNQSQFFLKAISYQLSVSSGFTMVETLVAVAVLMLAITAPLTMAEKSLATAEAARQDITAFYLAQEAFEFVKNVRDTNVISEVLGGWLAGLEECRLSNGCGIDPTNSSGAGTVLPCASYEGCTLYFNDGTWAASASFKGVYGHQIAGTASGWNKTYYQRVVKIQNIPHVAPDTDVEVKISVTVTRVGKNFGRTQFTASENMLRWYQP